jgi:hypothetical protein
MWEQWGFAIFRHGDAFELSAGFLYDLIADAI